MMSRRWLMAACFYGWIIPFAGAQTVVDGSGHALAPDDVRRVVEDLRTARGLGPEVTISDLHQGVSKHIVCGYANVPGGHAPMPFFVNTGRDEVWALFDRLLGERRRNVIGRLQGVGCLPPDE